MSNLTFTVDDLRVILPDEDPELLAIRAKDALARALLIAPCLGVNDLTQDQIDAVHAVLRAAIERWFQQTSPGVNINAGSFGMSPSAVVGQPSGRKGLFYPTEEDELRAICSGGNKKSASRWVI